MLIIHSTTINKRTSSSLFGFKCVLRVSQQFKCYYKKTGFDTIPGVQPGMIPAWIQKIWGKNQEFNTKWTSKCFRAGQSLLKSTGNWREQVCNVRIVVIHCLMWLSETGRWTGMLWWREKFEEVVTWPWLKCWFTNMCFKSSGSKHCYCGGVDHWFWGMSGCRSWG